MGFVFTSQFVIHRIVQSLFSRPVQIVKANNIQGSNSIQKVMNIGLYEVCLFKVTFCIISWPVRYLNRESNEYGTNIFIQHDLWSLSIHYHSSLFSGSPRYSIQKVMNIGLPNLQTIIYGYFSYFVIQGFREFVILIV